MAGGLGDCPPQALAKYPKNETKYKHIFHEPFLNNNFIASFSGNAAEAAKEEKQCDYKDNLCPSDKYCDDLQPENHTCKAKLADQSSCTVNK